ncbi:MAG: FAD-dependent oxidoreductase [Pseudomonadales bacterium]|nr:FAD-dependent oxidoreductase [Pseudomonadales bacterium]
MRHLVVGAGVLGLMTARELVLRGEKVCVLEAGEVGRQASWAGGGIISPLYPWRYPPAVSVLAAWAQVAYPELVMALCRDTGIDAQYQQTGLVMLDAEEGHEARAWSEIYGRKIELVSGHEVSRRWPGLKPQGDALWMPEIAHVRNPRLLKALLLDCQQRGVDIKVYSPLTHLECSQDTVRAAVDAAGHRYEADQFLLCAGAWTADLLRPWGWELPIIPVRGQMLAYRCLPGELSSMVMLRGRYLIPRRDGLVLAGSTLEDVGFDAGVTEQAKADLHASAVSIWPDLRDRQPDYHWSGLRPGSPEGVPCMGRGPMQNLWISAGHFRNGLVLAPASARLMAEMMLSEAPWTDPAPYAPQPL